MKERESWILYRQGKHKADRVAIADSAENNAYKLEAYQPKFFEILKRKNDLINDIGWLSAAWFYFICRGRYKIYYVTKWGGESSEMVFRCVVHGKNYKFPWMSKNDYQIAWCKTIEKHRGKNIYPWALQEIMQIEEGDPVMFVRTDNIASQKGVAKAGFEAVGKLRKTCFKVYKVV